MCYPKVKNKHLALRNQTATVLIAVFPAAHAYDYRLL